MSISSQGILQDHCVKSFFYVFRLAKSQILALQKMAIYFNDQSMYEIRQKECRQACLEYWSIPDVSRRTFIPDEDFSDTPTKRFNEIRKDYNISKANIENFKLGNITAWFKVLLVLVRATKQCTENVLEQEDWRDF